MRKEKILEILENAKDGNGAVPMRLVRTAFDKLPEPCEDTISRQAVIDLLKQMRKDGDMVPWEGKDVFARIRKLPSIQPEERTDKRTETRACDLISRQAAIDALDFEIVHITAYCDGKNEGNPLAQYNKGLEDGKKAIEELPSAQPEQRWIPCSERLPEESGYYIVTAHDGTGHRTTFVKYQKKDKSWYLTGARSYWKVIVWMPLPEPYKAEAERRTDDKTDKGSSC